MLGAHVGRIGCETAEGTLRSKGPGLQIPVAESPVHRVQAKQRKLMPWRQRSQILLISVHIHHRVGWHILCAVCEDVLTLWRIRWWKFIRCDLESVGNFAGLRRIYSRIDAKGVEPVRKLSCQIFGGITVIAPPACTCTCPRRVPVDLNARSPTVPSGLIPRLRIDQVFLSNARGWKRIQKTRRPVRPLRDWRVQLISQPIFQRPLWLIFHVSWT